MQQRVKINKAYYDEKTDSVCWQVVLLDGREADLIWMREEFGPTFNINADIPRTLIEEFCNNMVGKEINLVISDTIIGGIQ